MARLQCAVCQGILTIATCAHASSFMVAQQAVLLWEANHGHILLARPPFKQLMSTMQDLHGRPWAKARALGEAAGLPIVPNDCAVGRAGL